MSYAERKSNKTNTLKSWVNNYSDTLFTWALHKISSKEIAEDLVQDTFIAAFNSFEKFEEKSQPKTWLFAILNNKINDYHRNNFRNPVLSAAQTKDSYFDEYGNWQPTAMPQNWEDGSEHLLDNSEFKKVLDLCVQRLPKNWYSAIQLKYIDQKNGKQICQELEIAPTNFWQILHRAKMQLRQCLELNWFKK